MDADQQGHLTLPEEERDSGLERPRQEHIANERPRLDWAQLAIVLEHGRRLDVLLEEGLWAEVIVKAL